MPSIPREQAIPESLVRSMSKVEIAVVAQARGYLKIGESHKMTADAFLEAQDKDTLITGEYAEPVAAVKESSEEHTEE